MAESGDAAGRGRRPASGVRSRITAAAVAVVAAALLLASVALVLAVRSSLTAGLEDAADTRADAVAAAVEQRGLDAAPGLAVDSDGEVEDELVEVTRRGDLSGLLQGGESDRLRLDGDPYLVTTTDATHDGEEFVVAVAVAIEDVDDATGALVSGLAVGVPVLLLVLAGVTWLVVGRALRPVERIRAEVEVIGSSSLDRRVPEPGTRDEVGRLATTMNAMLARLEAARDQQRAFVSDASHELRSPIATLRQSAEVAQLYPDALEPGELAATVAAESMRMQHLVDQLLTLARTDEGSPTASEDVDLDDIALAEAARLRVGGLTVDTSAVRAVRLVGSGAAWRQVLRNLCDNAARHASSTVALSVTQQGGTVLVRVDDDGAGVAPADRQRVFERFVRLDEARARDTGGSGLGLAIVRDLVAGQGGSVSVSDSPLGGARFEVRLAAPATAG